jgi:hypothetical protein
MVVHTTMVEYPRKNRGWQQLLQRGIDSAAELSQVLAHKLGAVADPRAKLLRKRRWALRLGLVFAAGTLFWIGVTALLAVWNTPWWGLLITGILAGVSAFPATLLLLRYRWLHGEPLPPARSVRWLPPRGSAAFGPMSKLASAERGLFSLLGVLERGQMLPADELAEVTAAANHTALALAATANDVVSMERAAGSAPQSRAHLTPTIASYSSQLHAGVRQYDDIVTAAAQLVSAANSGSSSQAPMTAQRYRHELVSATDRLAAWAQAFDELGGIRRA